MNVADLSTPGDVTIPVEALHAIDAALNVTINRMTIGAVDLADLDWRVSLQEGRLVVPIEGKLVNKEDVYGEWEGGVGLDTTETVPVLSGRFSIHTLEYGQLLQNLELKPHLKGIANLEAEFSGEGATIGTILTHSTFKVEGKDISVTLPGDDHQNERTMVIAKADASVIKGGPLQMTAEGRFNDNPFTMTASSDKLVSLLEETGDWALDLSVNSPILVADLKGNLHLPFNGEDFSFQTLVNGEKLSNLNFLSTTPLPELGPFRVTGLLTQTKTGFSLDEFQGTLAESDISGSVALRTTGVRPHVIAKLKSNTIDVPSQAQEKQNADGQEAPPEPSDPDEDRLIPDVTFPVTLFREWDVDLDWHIKHVESPTIELDKMTIMAKLDDGHLAFASLKGTSWGGQVEINLELDVAGTLPTLALKATSVDLDLGRMLATLQATDKVETYEGRFLIDIKGRGHTLREVLSHANGEIDIIEGPFEIRTKAIDLWARDFLVEALTTVWKKKEITKFNCAVGYFDVENGIMKSDAILVDTPRITIAGIGGLNLGTENMDLVATPRSKNLTLLSTTHSVRFTGKITDPDVTNDRFQIAKSEGWTLLGYTNPLDVLVAVPGLLGTNLGTVEKNPCVAAMQNKHLTAEKIRSLNTGFFERIRNFFKNLGGSSDTSPENE
jgi:uncharacterized protein involved in outer membrane biogenesis